MVSTVTGEIPGFKHIGNLAHDVMQAGRSTPHGRTAVWQNCQQFYPKGSSAVWQNCQQFYSLPHGKTVAKQNCCVAELPAVLPPKQNYCVAVLLAVLPHSSSASGPSHKIDKLICKVLWNRQPFYSERTHILFVSVR